MEKFQLIRSGLGRSLILRVWLCSAVVLVAGAGYIFWDVRSNAYERTRLGLRSLAISGARQVEAELEVVEGRCNDAAKVVSLFRPDIAKLQEYIKLQVKDSPHISGMGCGFAANKIYTDKAFFCYYAWKEKGDIKGLEFNDGSFDYTRRQWYDIPKATMSGYWTSPYQSAADKLWVVSFGTPIEVDNGFAGAMVVDLNLYKLRNIATAVRFGAESRVFLVDRKSGKFVYYPQWSYVEEEKTLDKVINDQTDAGEIPLVRQILEGGAGETLVDSFASMGECVVSFQPLSKGDWSIGVVFPEDAIFAQIDELLGHSAAIAVFGFLLLALIMAQVTAKIVAPLKGLELAAAEIAGGNLVVMIPDIAEDNEVRSLAASLRKMAHGLRSLVSQVKSSIVRQVSTSTQIAAATASQDESISGFEKEVSQAAAAVAEISASARELAVTMDAVHKDAEAAGDAAGAGHHDLSELEKTMRSLTNATMSMAGKLELVRQSAEEVGGVVKTIADVAEQTNLLSLNASVEAEKAGEYGRGFSVVAREIRRLSDKTAVATLDIAQMVESMRSAVESGVAELEIFSETVSSCASTANEVGTALGGVISRVEGLGPKFERVNDGMQAQSLGATEISEAMVRLRERARAASESMNQLNDATEQLREAASLLRNEVSTFKTE